MSGLAWEHQTTMWWLWVRHSPINRCNLLGTCMMGTVLLNIGCQTIKKTFWGSTDHLRIFFHEPNEERHKYTKLCEVISTPRSKTIHYSVLHKYADYKNIMLTSTSLYLSKKTFYLTHTSLMYRFPISRQPIAQVPNLFRIRNRCQQTRIILLVYFANPQ